MLESPADGRPIKNTKSPCTLSCRGILCCALFRIDNQSALLIKMRRGDKGDAIIAGGLGAAMVAFSLLPIHLPTAAVSAVGVLCIGLGLIGGGLDPLGQQLIKQHGIRRQRHGGVAGPLGEIGRVGDGQLF